MIKSGEFGAINPQEELEDFIQESYFNIFFNAERREESEIDEDALASAFDEEYYFARKYVDPKEKLLFQDY